MLKIAIDFDGVLHQDDRGYGNLNPTIIKENPVPGAIEKLRELLINENVGMVTIFSLRCESEEGVKAMYKWLVERFSETFKVNPQSVDDFIRNKIRFSYVKPHANIYIDDRALRFDGDWNDPKFSMDSLLQAKPWNRSDEMWEEIIKFKEEYKNL